MALQSVVGDILWNLDVVGAIDNHQTLLVQGDRLAFDTRYFQFIRRPVSGNSRQQILTTLEKTFILFEEVIQSYQSNNYVNSSTPLTSEQIEVADNIMCNLKNLIHRQALVIHGLTTLSTFERYNQDSSFKLEMNRFIERISKLCRKCETLVSKLQTRLPLIAPSVPIQFSASPTVGPAKSNITTLSLLHASESFCLSNAISNTVSEEKIERTIDCYTDSTH